MSPEELQAKVDALMRTMDDRRRQTGMTLGDMIGTLEKMAPGELVDNLGDAASYRAYYADLAFAPTTGKVKAGVLLRRLRALNGETFTGYKGGDYTMGLGTAVWVASWGDLGERIVGFEDGKWATQKEG